MIIDNNELIEQIVSEAITIEEDNSRCKRYNTGKRMGSKKQNNDITESDIEAMQITRAKWEQDKSKLLTIRKGGY